MWGGAAAAAYDYRCSMSPGGSDTALCPSALHLRCLLSSCVASSCSTVSMRFLYLATRVSTAHAFPKPCRPNNAEKAGFKASTQLVRIAHLRTHPPVVRLMKNFWPSEAGSQGSTWGVKVVGVVLVAAMHRLVSLSCRST